MAERTKVNAPKPKSCQTILSMPIIHQPYCWYRKEIYIVVQLLKWRLDCLDQLSQISGFQLDDVCFMVFWSLVVRFEMCRDWKKLVEYALYKWKILSDFFGFINIRLRTIYLLRSVKNGVEVILYLIYSCVWSLAFFYCLSDYSFWFVKKL